MNLIFVKNLGFSMVCERSPYLYLMGRAKPDHVLPSFIENGARPISSGAVRPPLAPMLRVRGDGLTDGRAGTIRFAPSQGLEGIIIRCVGAALRGDGNPPEVPICRNSRP